MASLYRHVERAQPFYWQDAFSLPWSLNSQEETRRQFYFSFGRSAQIKTECDTVTKWKKEDPGDLDLRKLLKLVSLSNFPIWGMPFSEPQHLFTYISMYLFDMCGCWCACRYIGPKSSCACVCSHMCGYQRAFLSCSLDYFTLFLKIKSFLALELTRWARLVGKQGPGTCLSPVP